MVDNKEIKKESKLSIYIIIFIIIIIILAMGITYAYYNISKSNNTGITASANCYTVNYTKGQDISGELELGTSYTSGKSTDIVMYASQECELLTGNLYITTNESTTMDLSDEALRYAVVVNNEVVSEGYVSGIANQKIYSNFILNTVSTTYKVYLWLDSEKESMNSFDTEVYSGFIHADVVVTSTVASNPALETLAKLGLTSSIKDITLPESFTTSSANDNYPDGIYAVQDDLGTSYVFRGNVTNNYVKFGKYTEDAYSIVTDTGSSWEYSYASSCPSDYEYCTQIANANDDMYWRIVRINGDGSIRLIYDGTSAYANNSTSKNSYTGYYINYNYSYNDNAYVGYMYGTSGSTTYEATHANTNDSDLKKSIDAWYAKYLNGTSYEGNITDAIYCNDRTTNTTSTTWGSYTFTGQGYGTNNTLYGMAARSNLYTSTLYRYNSMTPKLTCEQQNDRFSVNNSVVGVATNGKLTYPVATITVDEMIYAGMWNYYNIDGSYNYNDITYLYGNWPWTMSAYGYWPSAARAWDGNYGAVVIYDVDHGRVARASVSLASIATITGAGTATNPFTVG